MTINENENENEKSSLILDLETLTAKYRELLIRYKQSVLDYTNNLNEQASKPCGKYTANSIGIDQKCYDEIWKNSGCTTTGKVDANSDSAKSKTLNELIYDSFTWATSKEESNRKSCYGTSEGSAYYLLGVGTKGNLVMCNGLETNWIEVSDNAANGLVSICTGNDGKMIVASKKDKTILYKSAWDAKEWKLVTNQNCCVISVAMAKDGTLVAIGTDNKLYSKPNLEGKWLKTSSSNEWVSSICIAPDDSIFAIGQNQGIFKKDSYKNLENQSWKYQGNSSCCVKAITIAPDGTFIGVGTDNQLYTKSSYKDLSGKWKGPYSNSCCVLGITTIPNPNYNGAIFSTLKKPNYNINSPILTEVKGQVFWGTSGVGESVSKTLQECSASCSKTPGCTGATFNPDKQYCWLRGGEGSTMPGSVNDYAIVPKSEQLLKIVESVNSNLVIVNRKLQQKINEMYSIYGEQYQIRDLKNYSLVSQYENLNKERKKINDIINDYQTLETTQNESNVYITKNYYLFFIFFLVVFVAIIVLSMLSVDENTSNVISFGIVKPSVEITQIIYNSINPYYVMFGIILIVVTIYLYNQYFNYTYIYNNILTLKNIGQLGVVYIVFIIIAIFIAISYYYNRSNSSFFSNFNFNM